MVKIDTKVIPMELTFYIAEYLRNKTNKSVIFEKIENEDFFHELLKRGFYGEYFKYQGFLFNRSDYERMIDDRCCVNVFFSRSSLF